MITLKCDMCGYECLWANIQRLPEGWEEVEHNELCEKCADKYHKFKNEMDEEDIAKHKDYFVKEKK